jgi:hypothetical protein
MKMHLLLFCLLAMLSASAQTGNVGADANKTFNIRGEYGRPLASAAAEIKGSPLVSENWGRGYVKFWSGRILKDIPLRFNLFNSELYYQLDGEDFIFIEPVNEFSFPYEDNGISCLAFFRNGYPGTKPASKQIFYEVLLEGSRFQLLKHNYKVIRESYGYGREPIKVFEPGSEWYVYDSQSKLIHLIKNKKPLTASVPELAVLVNRLKGNETGKFKSEKELIDLVARLNQ